MTSRTIQLDPKLTFETFFITPNASCAHAAALAVTQHPCEFNPLVLYGPKGVGKTHLLHAIGHRMHADTPTASIMYDSFKSLFDHNGKLLSKRVRERILNEWRDADVVLIDDVHSVVGGKSLGERLISLFCELCQSRKQVVIATASSIHDIMNVTIEPDAILTYKRGLTVEIEKETLQTRRQRMQAERVLKS